MLTLWSVGMFLSNAHSAYKTAVVIIVLLDILDKDALQNIVLADFRISVVFGIPIISS